MAVILKTVSSSFCRLTSTSGARVWCGIESTTRINSMPNASFFKDQDSSSFSKNTTGFSQSFDLLARCQAAVLTRHAVGVLERPIEVEKLVPAAPEARPETIDQPATPLPRSFLAESVSGNLVECCARGSRPLYTNVLAELQLRYTGQTEVVAVKEDQSAVKTAFLAALASAPEDARLVSEFAMFTWKSLGDLDAAEELYNKALALAPHDADIQASHALFLWQCDE